MSKRFQIPEFIFAWLIATGAQWDLVQVFGWGRMLVTYSRTMPLLEAAKKTFDGEMCGICKVVSEAKQKEASNTAGAKSDKKLVHIFQPVPTVLLTVPDTDWWSLSDRVSSSAQRSAPPTPPPRLSVA